MSLDLTNLIEHWPLNAASGDETGVHAGIVLTANASPGVALGKVGNGRDLELDSSQFFSAADSAALSTGNIDFSIACWVNLESKPASIMSIVGKFASANPSNGREYFLSWNNTADRFQFQVSTSGTAADATVSADVLGAPSTGTWYFIVAWHDSVNNVIGIQVNNGTANTAAHSAGLTNLTSAFQLGSRGNSTGSLFFDGVIDEVSFWKRILTTDEKTALYNSGSGIAYPFFTTSTVQWGSVAGRRQRYLHKSFTMPSGTGAVDYTLPQAGNLVKGAISSIAASALTLNTPANHAVWQLGVADILGNQANVMSRFQNGVTSPLRVHRGRDDAFIARVQSGSNATYQAVASFTGAIPHGVRLTHSTASATASLSNMLWIHGEDMEDVELVFVESSNTVNGTAAFSLPADTRAFIIATTNDDFDDDNHQGYMSGTQGFGSIDGSGNVYLVGQTFAFWYDAGVTKTYGYVSSDGLATIDPGVSESAIDGLFRITQETATDYLLHSVNPTSDGFPMVVAILPIAFGDIRACASVLTLPADSGQVRLTGSDFTRPFGFKPQFGIWGVSQFTDIDEFSSGAGSSTAGIGWRTDPKNYPDGAGGCCNTATSQAAVATSNAQSVSSDSPFYIPNGEATEAYEADFVAWHPGGMEINVINAIQGSVCPGVWIEQEDDINRKFNPLKARALG